MHYTRHSSALVLLALLTVLAPAIGARSPHAGPHMQQGELGTSKPAAAQELWPLDEALEYCAGLEDLYESIHDNLSPWKESGISRSLTAASIEKYSTKRGGKGVTLAFINGTAHVVDANVVGTYAHHANIFYTYMQVR
jgi:hypothetical protein